VRESATGACANRAADVDAAAHQVPPTQLTLELAKRYTLAKASANTRRQRSRLHTCTPPPLVVMVSREIAGVSFTISANERTDL
jgi:hypothetical protein